MFQFLKKITSPFTKLSSRLGDKIRGLFAKEIDEEAFSKLEQLLYEADLGAELSLYLAEKVRTLLQKRPDLPGDAILQAIRKELLGFFPPPQNPESTPTPYVFLFVGVNGSGKTTTLAKFAKRLRAEKKKVLIAACDTFRAAAIEQLAKWSQQIDADLIQSQPKSDPSSVAFDALSAAKARGSDCVLIDTAGRLQTKSELMHELGKMRRICEKQIPGAPHQTLLVIDATIGQNAIDQAKVFHQFTPLSGIVLTKLDGSAKGGIAIAVQKELGIPILWVGSGEGAEDLSPFEPVSFIDSLLNLDTKETSPK